MLQNVSNYTTKYLTSDDTWRIDVIEYILEPSANAYVLYSTLDSRFHSIPIYTIRLYYRQGRNVEEMPVKNR